MNWKIIFQLSLFGFIMACGTVALIPQIAEPAFWVVIFIFCALVIAKTCSRRYFLHGFFVSMVNSVWITLLHLVFYNTYITHHPEMLAMSRTMPPVFTTHPRMVMAISGPLFGAASGVVLGIFSLIASKFIKRDISTS